MELNGPNYLLLSTSQVSCEQWSFESQFLSLHFSDFHPVTCRIEDHILILLNLPDDISADFISDKLMKSFQDFNVDYFISNIFSDLSELSDYWKLQTAYLDRSLWFSGKHTIKCSSCFEKINNKSILDAEKRVTDSLQSGNYFELERAVQIWYQLLFDAKAPDRYVLDRLQILLNRCCELSGRDYVSVNISCFESIPSYVLGLLDRSNNNFIKYSGQIRRILQYINDNHQQEMTLQTASDDLFISPAYMTHTLKVKTGRSFSEWLRYFRIEHSKKLLANPELKNYEIAEQVGYLSYKILSEHFIKEEGITIKEYRQKIKDIHSSYTTLQLFKF